jgi:hypothetical protein
VVDLASGRIADLLRFDTTVRGIFAVTVLPGRLWQEVIHDDENRLENSFVVPDAAPADVPATLRAPILAVSPSAEVGDDRSEVCARARG